MLSETGDEAVKREVLTLGAGLLKKHKDRCVGKKEN